MVFVMLLVHFPSFCGYLWFSKMKTDQTLKKKSKVLFVVAFFAMKDSRFSYKESDPVADNP